MRRPGESVAEWAARAARTPVHGISIHPAECPNHEGHRAGIVIVRGRRASDEPRAVYRCPACRAEVRAGTRPLPAVEEQLW